MSCQTYAGLKSKFPVQYGPSHSAAGLFDGLLQTDQAVQAFRSCSCMPLENRHEKDVGDSLCSTLWCPASPDTCGKAPCTRVDSFGTLLPPQPISPTPGILAARACRRAPRAGTKGCFSTVLERERACLRRSSSARSISVTRGSTSRRHDMVACAEIV